MGKTVQKNHRCEELISKMILSLDRALSPDEELLFRQELEKCQSCSDAYDIEKSFKDFLVKKSNKSCCFETLAQNIRQKINGQQIK